MSTTTARLRVGLLGNNNKKTTFSKYFRSYDVTAAASLSIDIIMILGTYIIIRSAYRLYYTI